MIKQAKKITKICSIILATVSLTILGFLFPRKNKKNIEQTVQKIMNYKMPYIIKRCQKNHDYTDDDMKILEQELKRYLSLPLTRNKGEPSSGMYSRDVDNLWHTFILFTKEYSDFCQKHYGRYLHHVPRIENTKTEETKVNRFQVFLDRYESLFGDVHPIWFLDACEKGETKEIKNSKMLRES